MGNTIARVSPTALPQPSEEVKVMMMADGFTFGDKLDKVMVSTTLPEGWLLFNTLSRGDIERFSLLNKDGVEKYMVFWMSKGAYDNEGRISKASGSRKIDFSIVSVLDGCVVPIKVDEEYARYVDLANEYYDAPRYGQYQDWMDKRYAELISLGESFPKDNRLDIEKLESTRTSDSMGDFVTSAVNAQLVHSKRFFVPQVNPWITILTPDDL